MLLNAIMSPRIYKVITSSSTVVTSTPGWLYDCDKTQFISDISVPYLLFEKACIIEKMHCYNGDDFTHFINREYNIS